MAKGIMFFLRSTDDMDTVNTSVHILYTFNYYFASLIETNWEFAPNDKNPKVCGECAKYLKIIHNNLLLDCIITMHLLINKST